MSTEKFFVCLANSAREGGRCIAGKEIILNQDKKEFASLTTWFRPLGKDSSALSSRYVSIKIGQIVQCIVDEAKPDNVQPENCIVKEDTGLSELGTITTSNLADFLEYPTTLWETGYSSSLGENDKVPLVNLIQNAQSLYFVEIGPHTIYKKQNTYEGAKPRLKIEFSYNDITYCLTLTANTPYWNVLGMDESKEINQGAYITISLAQPFYGNCYKLVAGYVLI